MARWEAGERWGFEGAILDNIASIGSCGRSGTGRLYPTNNPPTPPAIADEIPCTLADLTTHQVSCFT